MDLAEILQAVLKLGLFILSQNADINWTHHFVFIWCVFRRLPARIARSDFWGHILDQTPQTEVHTKNQLPRYLGSGPI